MYTLYIIYAHIVQTLYIMYDQIANIHWIIKKARDFQKNIYFCFIDYTKAFDCVDHNKQKRWEYQTTLSALPAS